MVNNFSVSQVHGESPNEFGMVSNVSVSLAHFVIQNALFDAFACQVTRNKLNIYVKLTLLLFIHI